MLDIPGCSSIPAHGREHARTFRVHLAETHFAFNPHGERESMDRGGDGDGGAGAEVEETETTTRSARGARALACPPRAT
jgi:hypothetical protein